MQFVSPWFKVDMKRRAAVEKVGRLTDKYSVNADFGLVNPFYVSDTETVKTDHI